MTSESAELAQRKQKALAAIRAQFNANGEDADVREYIEHHLEELDADYWLDQLSDASPDPARVLDLLVLESHWSADDDVGMDTLDFTLPGDVTDYIISVSFNDSGDVDFIAMES